MVLGDLYTFTQAKRLYSLVWTGSLLGAAAGGSGGTAAGRRRARLHAGARRGDPPAVTAFGPAVALGRVGARSTLPRPPATMAEGLAILKGDAYVRGLAVLVLVSTVALTLGGLRLQVRGGALRPRAGPRSFFGGLYAV